jgi:hypothetical protein
VRLALVAAAVLSSALTLPNCADSASQRVYINSGSLCLRPAGTSLRAEIKLLGCLSSSCNREVANACAMSRDKQQISISSRLVIEPNRANCATDCGSWVSRCELPAPDAGTYSVAFGEGHYSLPFPLAMDTELVADGSTRGCASEEPELGGPRRM